MAESCKTDSIVCQCCGLSRPIKSFNQNEVRRLRRTCALREAKCTVCKDMLKCERAQFVYLRLILPPTIRIAFVVPVPLLVSVAAFQGP